MSVTTDIIKTDLAVCTANIMTYIANKRLWLSDKTIGAYKKLRTPEVDSLINSYLDTYQTCLNITNSLTGSQMPGLSAGQCIGYATSFSVTLKEGVIDRTDLMFHRPIHRVLGENELVQLNRQDRHAAIKLIHNARKLENLTHAIKNHSSITTNKNVLMLTSKQCVPGIEYLIDSMTVEKPDSMPGIHNKPNAPLIVNESQTIKIDNLLITLINYKCAKVLDNVRQTIQNAVKYGMQYESILQIQDIHTNTVTEITLNEHHTLGNIVKYRDIKDVKIDVHNIITGEELRDAIKSTKTYVDGIELVPDEQYNYGM